MLLRSGSRVVRVVLVSGCRFNRDDFVTFFDNACRFPGSVKILVANDGNIVFFDKLFKDGFRDVGFKVPCGLRIEIESAPAVAASDVSRRFPRPGFRLGVMKPQTMIELA